MDRLELQKKFEDILGSREVYFQPPESVRMRYPAILYNLNAINTDKADNRKYKYSPQYTVTLMDYDPESVFVKQILELPYCEFKTFYTKDNLNHFTFTLFY